MASTNRMKRILIAGGTFCTGAALTAYIGTCDTFQVSSLPLLFERTRILCSYHLMRNVDHGVTCVTEQSSCRESKSRKTQAAHTDARAGTQILTNGSVRRSHHRRRCNRSWMRLGFCHERQVIVLCFQFLEEADV